MNQAQLNDAYDQRVYAPNFETVFERFLDQTASARLRLGEPETFRYGSAANEDMLVYRAESENAPIHVFIHGGAWRLGSAENYIAVAEPIVNSDQPCSPSRERWTSPRSVSSWKRSSARCPPTGPSCRAHARAPDSSVCDKHCVE